jgi:hypothetical protein
VGSVITALSGLPRLIWGNVRQRWEPDHGALYGGSWALTTTTSSDARIRVQVVCAPENSLGLQAINPDRAIILIKSAFPNEFPEIPVFSMPGHGVRFERGAGLDDGYAWAWITGRVDYDCRIEPKVDDGQIVVPLLPILEAIAKVARAVVSPEYRAVYQGASKLPKRFDWFIGVSPTVTTGDGRTREWTDLDFPGRRPSRAGSESRTFCPADGYAAASLRSWDPKSPIRDLLTAFLEDFLHQNGFYNCAGSIEDTLTRFTDLDNSSKQCIR